MSAAAEEKHNISISLVPVYSAETRPIGEIGCDDCIINLDTVDLLRSDGPMPMPIRVLIGWPCRFHSIYLFVGKGLDHGGLPFLSHVGIGLVVVTQRARLRRLIGGGPGGPRSVPAIRLTLSHGTRAPPLASRGLISNLHTSHLHSQGVP